MEISYGTTGFPSVQWWSDHVEKVRYITFKWSIRRTTERGSKDGEAEEEDGGGGKEEKGEVEVDEEEEEQKPE